MNFEKCKINIESNNPEKHKTTNHKPQNQNCLQAHHLFKLHRLPAAYFYFFAALQLQ
jgi:hypothetical protein